MKRLLFLSCLLVGCGSEALLTTPSSPPVGPVQVATLTGAADAGAIDGPLAQARFNNPTSVEINPTAEQVFVTDFDNSRVRKVTAQGVSTLVNRPADFQRPFAITLGPDGFLYVQTDANDLLQRDGTTGTVWKIDPNSGNATVVARNLGRPRGLCSLPDGRIVMSNLTKNVVELLDPATGNVTPLAGLANTPGFVNGTGAVAQFDRAYGIALHPQGFLLLADQNNNCIRQVTLTGQVTTFAGTGVAGFQNGDRAAAQFDHPQDVAIDQNGVIYVTDNGNHRIRRIDPSGQVTSLAGDGIAGFRDGLADQAEFFGQEALCVVPSGNLIVVADGNSGTGATFNRIRTIFR